MEVKDISKKLKLKLVGLDGNAFMLMGAFRRQARKEGWDQEEIDTVIKESMNGDYIHLTNTLGGFCEDGGF